MRVSNPMDIEEAWSDWNKGKADWNLIAGMKAQVVLVEAMLKKLVNILKGEVAATSIMFPGSSMELVEGVYRNNAVADYFNEVISGAVAGYIEERIKQDPRAKVRIIEIGAGTGGTSKAVFRKLKGYKDHIEEYCYTDISKAFLIYGEKEFWVENPYLTYKIFNVEEAVNGQGIYTGSYDIAIAANVLHATEKYSANVKECESITKEKWSYSIKRDNRE